MYLVKAINQWSDMDCFFNIYKKLNKKKKKKKKNLNFVKIILGWSWWCFTKGKIKNIKIFFYSK